MKKIDFEFTTAGESPDFGTFNAGDVHQLDEAVARVLADRGMGKIQDKTQDLPRRHKGAKDGI